MADPTLLNSIKKVSGSASEEAPGGCIIIPSQDIEKVVRFLAEEHGFDYLMNLTAIDYKDKFAVVYNLYSFKSEVAVSLKAFMTKEDAVLPSITRIYPGANWHEREAYDLMGITFTAHPDLKRILLPDDWVGHPLRKDYVKEGLVKMPRA